MTQIVRDCSKFEGAKFPVDCGKIDYGFPQMLFIGKRGTSITAVASVPTVAEMQIAVNQGLVIAIPISNGSIPKPEITSIDGADTDDGLPVPVNEKNSLNGKLKSLNDNVRKALQALNVHNRVQLWYATNKGYLFGEKNGYTTSWYTPGAHHEGFGQTSTIDLEGMIKWWRDAEQISITNSTADINYKYIQNPENLTFAVIAAMAGGNASALTIQMLIDAGITGTVPANLSGYQTAIGDQVAGSINSLEELQIIVSTVNSISA